MDFWWLLMVGSLVGLVLLVPFAALLYGEVKEGEIMPLNEKGRHYQVPRA